MIQQQQMQKWSDARLRREEEYECSILKQEANAAGWDYSDGPLSERELNSRARVDRIRKEQDRREKNNEK